jgi:hypothetical protein
MLYRGREIFLSLMMAVSIVLMAVCRFFNFIEVNNSIG